MTQATRHKMQGWLVQCTFALLLLVMLFSALHAARAAAAAPADDGVAAPAARALPGAAYVNADGTLKTGVGAQARVDVSGWHVTLDPRRGPILAPQPQIQAGIHTAEQPKGWSPLGTGITSTVRAIAITGTDVYVGGQFASIPGCAGDCKYIAKWDGTNWSEVGGGVNGLEVDAILIQGTDVYAAGVFGKAGTCNTGCVGIAKWDGTAWSALSTGLNGGAFALAISGTDLYVGGRFTAAGNARLPANTSPSGTARPGRPSAPAQAIGCSPLRPRTPLSMSAADSPALMGARAAPTSLSGAARAGRPSIPALTRR